MVGGKSLSRSGLLRKQSEIVIAMMGTLPGAGVTYSVISLGTYLAHHCHYRVALVENNESMHFSYIKRAAGVIGAENYFSIGKMDFYERADEDIWLRLQRMPYDYILVDYGVYDGGKQSQYARCQYRFLIGSLCEWKREAYEEIIHKESTGIEMSFYLATLGQRYDIREYYREFGMRLYSTPCIYDPFLLVKEVIQFWRRFPI
ncbi:hypothetical protein SAMN02746066_02034 [Anaerosporobacter mobilis DSM 15930]|uniref:Uncharacterized protein n=1 Tax=Anaerosporobacter mobilis DSM 15930 TaxID=1120996 RepID=A0A1M7J081_9FIRM|nr:hypothetical protein [Anaerosporobacter mobilis]SHM45837.1 hypothetical protein SAMN02746066_02034 [Anaerosporobacter mobilis DSM 15930]